MYEGYFAEVVGPQVWLEYAGCHPKRTGHHDLSVFVLQPGGRGVNFSSEFSFDLNDGKLKVEPQEKAPFRLAREEFTLVPGKIYRLQEQGFVSLSPIGEHRHQVFRATSALHLRRLEWVGQQTISKGFSLLKYNEAQTGKTVFLTDGMVVAGEPEDRAKGKKRTVQVAGASFLIIKPHATTVGKNFSQYGGTGYFTQTADISRLSLMAYTGDMYWRTFSSADRNL